MNFILSIFLCFALAFGGTAALPAEPETATTWTIRNVTLTDGEDAYTLNPEAHLTTAAGAEKIALQFSLENDGKTLLPISAEITPEALTFALSNSGRAYTLSDEDFVELIELDEEDARILEIFGDLMTSYAALIGMASGDEEQTLAYSEAVSNALIETCGGEIAPVEIELDGETIQAEQVIITLTYDSTFELLDALRGCGFDAMESFLNALLDMINLVEETEYPDFVTLAAELHDAEDAEFSLPIVLTFAEGDDLVYGLIECAMSMEDEDAAMLLREEIVNRGEDTTVDATVTLNGVEGLTADYVISVQATGPITNPSRMHMDYGIHMETPVYYTGGSGTYTSEADAYMVLDIATEDELTSAAFSLDLDADNEIVQMLFSWEEHREDDGSITANAAFSAFDDEDWIGITFELNRAESEYVNLFEGAEPFVIDADIFEGEGEEISATAAALTADAALLTVDAMTLSADESIRALAALGEITDIEYADPDYYDDPLTVNTLEEAAEVYEGRIPSYTAPEGYEIVSITVDPDYMDIEYESEGDAFDVTLYNYSADSSAYILGDEGFTQMDSCMIRLYQYGSDNVSYAEVYLPDGTMVDVYFYGNPTVADVQAILSGFNQ